jgi:hypothetical protein
MFLFVVVSCFVLKSAKATDFQVEWNNAAISQLISPARNINSDQISYTWQSVIGRPVVVAVRKPISTKKHFYRIPCPQVGVDGADEFVQSELSNALRIKANHIQFSSCSYHFHRTQLNGLGHFLLIGLSDVVLDGGGASFVFHANKPGIYVEDSQRLIIKNFNLSYAFVSTSVGMIGQVGGDKGLILSEKYSSAPDSIFQLTELRGVGLSWVRGGKRLIVPPEKQDLIYRRGDRFFVSKMFNSLPLGARFFVSHYWYGGQAIYIGSRGATVGNEDISIVDNVISSTPGVAIAVEQLRRGIAIVSNKITPNPDGISAGSSAWDGIHVSQSGGDVFIKNNQIMATGDDAINISNHVQKIEGVHRSTKALILRRYVGRIKRGLRFFVFDATGVPYAKGTVSRVIPLGDGRHVKVILNNMPSGVKKNDAIRFVDFISSRAAIVDNFISECACHGLLLQIPNAIVVGNFVSNTRQSAIRLLADTTKWYEGVGILNVAVLNNLIYNPGVDDDSSGARGAISLYANVVGSAIVNFDVNLVGNRMVGVLHDCLYIANSARVSYSNNVCEKE